MRHEPRLTGEKVCFSCKRPKPVLAFAVDKRNRDGLQGECRSCMAERHRHNPKTQEKKVRRVQFGRNVLTVQGLNASPHCDGVGLKKLWEPPKKAIRRSKEEASAKQSTAAKRSWADRKVRERRRRAIAAGLRRKREGNR